MIAAFDTMRAFMRERSGSALIELGVGTVMMLGISMAVFDVYSAIKATTAASRIASSISDYVSRETGADYGDRLAALGQFLYERELGTSVAAVYVVSAARKSPGDDAELLWRDDSIRFGDSATTVSLAQECDSLGREGWQALILGASPTLTLDDGEVVIVAEVCAKPLGEGSFTDRIALGGIYRIHATPARDGRQIPHMPIYLTDLAIGEGEPSAGEFQVAIVGRAAIQEINT